VYRRFSARGRGCGRAGAGIYPGPVRGPTRIRCGRQAGASSRRTSMTARPPGLFSRQRLIRQRNDAIILRHRIRRSRPPDPKAASRLSVIPIGCVRRDARIVSGSNPQRHPGSSPAARPLTLHGLHQIYPDGYVRSHSRPSECRASCPLSQVELTALDGHVLVIQPYSQTVDPTLSYRDLPALGSILKLPSSWPCSSRRSRVLSS
jgi:hypothetical protein